MYHINTNYYFYETVRQDPQKRRTKWPTVTVRLTLTSQTRCLKAPWTKSSKVTFASVKDHLHRSDSLVFYSVFPPFDGSLTFCLNRMNPFSHCTKYLTYLKDAHFWSLSELKNKLVISLVSLFTSNISMHVVSAEAPEVLPRPPAAVLKPLYCSSGGFSAGGEPPLTTAFLLN